MENAIIVIMTFLVLGLAGIPLFRERRPEEDLATEADYGDPDLDKLLSRKETALEAIRELEFDRAVGSLSDEDYVELKERYEKKAISVLKNIREMDEVSGDGRSRQGGRNVRPDRAKREDWQAVREVVCPECGTAIRPEARFCSVCGAERDVYEDRRSACLECGEPYEAGDVFCASCGARLEPVEEEFAPDGGYVEDFAGDKPAEARRPQKPSGNAQPKRRSRPSANKKPTDNSGSGHS
ncbi:MAG: zinc ribbon domain-containing protein [Chloroflexi bacterium]|nr:zinc ribbon domain-containing protein [Chloroflexota bacterium]